MTRTRRQRAFHLMYVAAVLIIGLDTIRLVLIDNVVGFLAFLACFVGALLAPRIWKSDWNKWIGS